MHIAAAMPMVSQNRAEMKERRLKILLAHIKLHGVGKGAEKYLVGACVNANSNPVIITNASENATRMYAGA
jgi:hypothetical protein